MRSEINLSIRAHRSFNRTEDIVKCQTLRFIEAHPNNLKRSCLIGHRAISAWLVTPNRRSTVLVHHKKLNRWLPLGGYTDGNGNWFVIALHEASEKTGLGLSAITLVTDLIFNIDVHKIPKHGAEPAHMHYDIKWIFQVSEVNSPGNDKSYEVQFLQLMKSKNLTMPILLRGWC